MVEQKQKDREAAGNALMNFLLFVAAIAMIVPIGSLAWEFLIKRG